MKWHKVIQKKEFYTKNKQMQLQFIFRLYTPYTFMVNPFNCLVYAATVK